MDTTSTVVPKPYVKYETEYIKNPDTECWEGKEKKTPCIKENCIYKTKPGVVWLHASIYPDKSTWSLEFAKRKYIIPTDGFTYIKEGTTLLGIPYIREQEKKEEYGGTPCDISRHWDSQFFADGGKTAMMTESTAITIDETTQKPVLAPNTKSKKYMVVSARGDPAFANCDMVLLAKVGGARGAFNTMQDGAYIVYNQYMGLGDSCRTDAVRKGQQLDFTFEYAGGPILNEYYIIVSRYQTQEPHSYYIGLDAFYKGIWCLRAYKNDARKFIVYKGSGENKYYFKTSGDLVSSTNNVYYKTNDKSDINIRERGNPAIPLSDQTKFDNYGWNIWGYLGVSETNPLAQKQEFVLTPIA